MLVRETAALQLQRRRADWAHSRPVIALDIAWNVAFAAAAAAVLASSAEEIPVTPLRLWLVGYAAQWLVHVGLVCTDSRRGTRRARGSASASSPPAQERTARTPTAKMTKGRKGGAGGARSCSSTSRCETMNTLVSFLWRIIGFYWLVSGGEVLEYGAPSLYWLTVVFLAFDVFFAVFSVVVACFIGIALCCCLPYVIQTVQQCHTGRNLSNGSKANVHTGALPPWLKANEHDPKNLSLRRCGLPSQKGKLRKLNPKRVVAAWAEKRRADMEMEKQGEIVPATSDSSWLPNLVVSGNLAQGRNQGKNLRKATSFVTQRITTYPWNHISANGCTLVLRKLLTKLKSLAATYDSNF